MTFKRQAPSLNDRIYHLFSGLWIETASSKYSDLARFCSDRAGKMTRLEATLDFIESTAATLDHNIDVSTELTASGQSFFTETEITRARAWLERANPVINEIRAVLGYS